MTPEPRLGLPECRYSWTDTNKSKSIGGMSRTSTDGLLEFVRDAGLVRPRDLEAAGVPRGYLSQLARRGLLERVGRGLYAMPGAAPSEHRSLAEVSKRTPRGVICLTAALRGLWSWPGRAERLLSVRRSTAAIASTRSHSSWSPLGPLGTALGQPVQGRSRHVPDVAGSEA